VALLAALEAKEILAAIDVKIVADLPATAIALAHVGHLARQYGVRVADGVFARVTRLAGDVSLAGSKVQSIEPAAARLSIGRSGARLEIGGEATEIGQIVLADDAAILGRLPEEQRPDVLVPRSMTATLTAPARRLEAPVMRYPDRGVTLVQRADRAVLAFIADERDLDQRLASTLPGPFPLQRRASTRFRRLETRDGAPLVGRLKPSKLFVIAGLGEAGAFVAPALARLLAGRPAEAEKPWFAAHDPARSSREAIADLAEALP
jgi:hypothetical protein